MTVEWILDRNSLLSETQESSLFSFFCCTRYIMYSLAHLCLAPQDPFSVLVTGEALEQAGDHYLPLDATRELSRRSVTIIITTMHGFVFAFSYVSFFLLSENTTHYVVLVEMYSAKPSTVSFTCLEKATCLLFVWQRVLVAPALSERCY